MRSNLSVEAKRTLLRRILAQLALVRQTQLAAASPRPLTQQELWMQAIAGITFVALGLIAVAFLGLPQAFNQPVQALFLIFAGEAAAVSGAWLVQYYYQNQNAIGKLLFALCFLASVACVVVGLFNVFEHSGESIFLIVVGFAGAFLSALALK
jgi:hypothetical protein